MEHIAKFYVTMELIRESLALPEDCTITFIHPSDRMNEFTFIIEHPLAPLCEPGQAIPEITPVFHTDYSKRPATWITCDLFGKAERL